MATGSPFNTTEKFSVRFSPIIDLPVTEAEPISPQGVDVWLLDLGSIDVEESKKFLNILSQDELERAEQFNRNRHHFIATRALLRKTLSRYTRLNAHQLLFSREMQGKPFLANSPVPLYFNLSHSRDFAALAICSLGDVGVDIERPRQRDYLKIVKRFFHPDEYQQLLACDEAKREQMFYSMWTLKEAFFKAIGTGISGGLDKACFYLHDNNIAVQFSNDLQPAKRQWQFHQATVATNTTVALAVDTEKAIGPHWFDGNCLLCDKNS